VNIETRFPGKLAIQQRVLPSYRAAFFNQLAGCCQGGLSVLAGLPLPEENTTPVKQLELAHLVQVSNINLFRTTSPFYQCWQPGLIRWLETWQPDVLIVEGNPRTKSTHQAVRWMHQRKKPVLGWGLGAPLLHGTFKFWRERTRRLFLEPLDGMIAYSQRGADEYRNFGFPDERIFIAPNAVAARPGWPMPDRPVSYASTPVVLFVGRLQKRKRIDILLQACAALPESLQPHLIIVGDGPARDEFDALAKRIYPSAEFPGSQYGSELDECFRRADLFVLPGTGGLAVQQAMTYGLPVIVGEGDGTQDDLVRPENGWLLSEAGVAGLTAVLQEALSDLSRLRKMGQNSYTITCKEVNLELMAAAFTHAAIQIHKQVSFYE
jgi:glycosyltransferase involved in cell wall biosynthesis